MKQAKDENGGIFIHLSPCPVQKVISNMTIVWGGKCNMKFGLKQNTDSFVRVQLTCFVHAHGLPWLDVHIHIKY